MRIAWIGTGVMGISMVLNIYKSNPDIKVFNRTKAKAEPLKSYGIQVCDSIAQAVHDADVVFTMVGYPKDVEEVYLGENGILKNIGDHTICIDMTTSSPSFAKKLYELNQNILDCPVSGGDIGAKNGTLSIMVGGKEQNFKTVLPLLNLLGKNITYFGEGGSGQNAKLANQISVAGTTASTVESLYYAEQKGLDLNKIINSISTGAGSNWQITNNGPKILQNNFEPGFYIKHFIKDMNLIKQEIKPKKLMVLNTVLKMYKKLAKKGKENLGTQALIHYYYNN